MKTLPVSGALALALSLRAFPAAASEPASHDVTVPTTPGQTVVVEWTGTALPGATGIGTTGAIADPSLEVGCPSPGPDDSHTITFTVPAAGYGTSQVTADFHVEWQQGTTYADAVGDPDLKLSVYLDTTEVGWSDGGTPEENVSLKNPQAGTYSAVVCPFTASQPTPYRGRLTLTAQGANACLLDASHPLANSSAPSGPFAPPPDEFHGLPNFDAFRNETRSIAKTFPTDLHGRYQPAIYDRSLGVPTFLWARTDAPVAAVGALNEHDLLVARARAHLRNEAKELHLSNSLIDQAQAIDAQFNGEGPAVVRFHQRVDGLEVFHRSLNVLMNRQYQPIAVSGYFAPASRTGGSFTRSAPEAIALAWADLGGQMDPAALALTQIRGEWQLYSKPALSGSHVLERGPRARKVYYARANGLEPAYYVELFANAKVNKQLMAYALVVSANDGSILHRENLKADAAYSYRVFAATDGDHQPFDSPLGNGYAPFPGARPTDHPARHGAGSSLVTLDNAGIKTGDPWLADGATETIGNHVDACLDSFDVSGVAPVGLVATDAIINRCQPEAGDMRPTTTGANSFDYPIAADQDPAGADAQAAAIVNLFYMNNWLHDTWYNHGFDEVSGNAQTSNYGRGGAEGDPLLAQGQDGSGRNNANMSTPADGSSPVMQQYLFDGRLTGEVREVTPVAGSPLTWTAVANAGQSTYDLTGSLALADDGTGDSPTDGCGPAIPYPPEVVDASPVGAPYKATVAPPQPALQGKIAVVDRGGCNTTFKIQFAQASGAIGLIVVNNVDGDPPSNIGNLDIPLSPVEPTQYAYMNMPTVIIRKDDGTKLKTQLAAGEVTMHLSREAAVDVDGTLDNQIIAHEYFHYVHHRLTESSNQQANAMSEGWGDIDAFMLTVRPDDRFVPGNDQLQGAYGLASYVTNNFFSGIRRAPYSTSFAVNAFTFKHIQDGVPTPDGGAGDSNSEVHNAGEIWANMMFECYVGIQDSPANHFADAKSKMQDYIIGGFKMTPADATYTEARDAVLAVALASDFEDFSRCSHGFARRGNGLNAVAPARGSPDLTGVVEDYSDFVCTVNVGPRSGGVVGSAGDGSGVVLGGALGLAGLLPLLGAALLPRRRRRLH